VAAPEQEKYGGGNKSAGWRVVLFSQRMHRSEIVHILRQKTCKSKPMLDVNLPYPQEYLNCFVGNKFAAVLTPCR
jgi:hypothetical protein